MKTVEVIFQSHHAAVSDYMRHRTRRAIDKAAQRLHRPVAGVARFEEDGPTRRVELLVHWPGHRIVAGGSGRSFRTAISSAIQHLKAQTRQSKRTPKSRTRHLARA